MKTLILSLAVLLPISTQAQVNPANQLPTATSNSPYYGKLDILSLPAPSPCAFREFKNGNWTAGAEEQIWSLHLKNSSGDHEVLHVSYVQTWLADSGFPLYGGTLGFNLAGASATLGSVVSKLAPDFDWTPPKWLANVSNWTTLEGGWGYRPVYPSGDSPQAWLLGGKVIIPVNLAAGL